MGEGNADQGAFFCRPTPLATSRYGSLLQLEMFLLLRLFIPLKLQTTSKMSKQMVLLN